MNEAAFQLWKQFKNCIVKSFDYSPSTVSLFFLKNAGFSLKEGIVSIQGDFPSKYGKHMQYRATREPLIIALYM